MQKQKIDSKVANSMQLEANRLLKEFEDYVEDLRLYSNPEFWEAMRQKPGKKYKSVREFAKERGWDY